MPITLNATGLIMPDGNTLYFDQGPGGFVKSTTLGAHRMQNGLLLKWAQGAINAGTSTAFTFVTNPSFASGIESAVAWAFGDDNSNDRVMLKVASLGTNSVNVRNTMGFNYTNIFVLAIGY